MQIADWIGRTEAFSLWPERIYQHIRTDQHGGGQLYRQLRQRLGPKRKQAKTPYKGSMAHRVSIEDRPAIVNEKNRLGDWEVDLMMGGHGGSGLLTFVERKSRHTH